MAYEKVYVETIVKFLLDGTIRPLEIIWQDGQRFKIERLKKIEKAPARVGTLVVKRYTVMICGVEKYLYYEEYEKKWFVERKL